ncbi:ankyrin repeat domain-containing protein [Dactylosporangium sp. AC04546]|uniref:ankyrin repeat domain-containing protein n=1 Tax=Dactylosporangium sp. AC04546 TaxID=2862460 RepID=UPI001EE01565|nr:ankyrin repeat domain-containing protein [Dactylosporangium sp. AC04546]WVK79103.1 ankyrin repeat domain-containing protein [Dactylosporangium sp. AC04546]
MARHGGRLPFLTPSPPGTAEEIIALQDAGGWRKAWRLAGFDIDALADASPHLQEQARHGDGPALTAWLDAGLDPHLRTDHGRTMLHLIVWLPDPAPLLARLLAAGLDIDARDQYGDTPLRYAITSGGSIAAIRALAAADATTDGWEEAAERASRSTELRFLSAPRNPGTRTPVPNDNSSHAMFTAGRYS